MGFERTGTAGGFDLYGMIVWLNSNGEVKEFCRVLVQNVLGWGAKTNDKIGHNLPGIAITLSST